MSIIPLKDIMKELVHLEVNRFTNGKSGTIQLAESYIELLDHCTSKKVGPGILEMYFKGKKFGHIKGQSPSTNNKLAIRIANDKIETENILKENNINTTDSRVFHQEDYFKAKEFISSSSKPMVLKPYNLNGGRGITLNINENNFDFAWKQAVNAYIDKGKRFKVMIQPMVEGFEVRMLIIENKFNSAILRMPANIVGDGQSTIEELIATKNEMRATNPYLKRHTICITDVIKFNLDAQDIDLDTVPNKDQLVFLQNSSNVTQGGDNYEVSHLISKDLIETAEKSILTVPGFHTGGVDLMVKSFTDDKPVVLELNPGANLRMHHYPWKGQPKKPVHDLIDALLASHKN